MTLPVRREGCYRGGITTRNTDFFHLLTCVNPIDISKGKLNEIQAQNNCFKAVKQQQADADLGKLLNFLKSLNSGSHEEGAFE